MMQNHTYPIPDAPIESIIHSTRGRRVLKENGIHTVHGFLDTKPEDIRKLHGIGEHTMCLIRLNISRLLTRSWSNGEFRVWMDSARQKGGAI